jgi:DNA-binding CsgD family transcriptional regulator
LAELDEAAASDAADALATAFILESGRPLSFVHPLVRGSVYAELDAGERDRWHGRAAAALAVARAPADRVAVHLLACDPRSDPSAVNTLREAARSAHRRGATETAIAHLRRARREPPPPELQPQVDFELGAAELQAGAFGAAAGLLAEAAQRLPTPATRGMAAAQLGGALMFTGQVEEAVDALSAALDALPEEERELGLRLQVLRNATARGSPAARHRAQGAVDRFQAQADPPATAAERLWVAELAHRASLRETAEHARDLARRALGDGALLDDPGPSDPMFYPAPITLLLAGALEEATGVFSAVLEWARRHGSVFAFSQAAHLRAYCWWARGALSEAEADAELALAHPSFMVRPGVMALLEVRLVRGDVAGASQLWRDTRMDDDRLVGQSTVAHLAARAHLRAALGRTQDALDDLLGCGRLEDEWDIRTPALTNWRSDAAGLLASLGQREEARRLAREGLERSRLFGAAHRLGDSLLAAGRLEERPSGLALLEEAVDVLAPSSARLGHANALFELGAALRRAGKRADARGPLRDAIELARLCGAEPLATRAHDELVAAGARPRRDPIESRSQLTASELRVARLAADGMTNREIAQALFLTEKTIEVHLTSSYRKLDIGSRTQLARALPAA